MIVFYVFSFCLFSFTISLPLFFICCYSVFLLFHKLLITCVSVCILMYISNTDKDSTHSSLLYVVVSCLINRGWQYDVLMNVFILVYPVFKHTLVICRHQHLLLRYLCFGCKAILFLLFLLFIKIWNFIAR